MTGLGVAARVWRHGCGSTGVAARVWRHGCGTGVAPHPLP